MPDRDYNVNYNATGNMPAFVAALTAEVRALDAAVTALNPKLRELGKGTSAAPINALARAMAALNTNMAAANTGANNAAGSVRRVAAAATSAAAGINGANTAAQGLGRSLGTGARNAAAMAPALGRVGTAAAAMTPALAGATAAAAGLRGATAGIATSTRSASTSMGGFMGKMLALQAAKAVIGAVYDESKRLEEMWKALAKEAGEFRESLRELASLKGQSGANNNVTADTLSLALAAGMSTDKAREFELAYQNFGPTVRDKKHFGDDKDKAAALEAEAIAETGKTARRLGVGADEAGGALGVAGMIHKFASKEDAMEQVGGALLGLSEGSVTYSAGLKALNIASAKLVNPEADDKAEMAAEGAQTGKLGSYAEAGTTLGVFSLSTGGSAMKAGHQMVQTSRALNPAKGYHGGEAEAALRAAGVEGKNLPDQVVALSEYMEREKIADPRKWMEDHGVGTVATREVVAGQLKNAGVLRERIARRRASEKTNTAGKKTIADNDSYMATDRTAEEGRLAAQEEALNKTDSIAGAEQYEKAKRAAEVRLRTKIKPRQYFDPSLGLAREAMSWVTRLTRGVSGEGAVQEEGALKFLRKEGKRVGVDVDKMFPNGDLSSSSPVTRAQAFTKASDAVKAAGGDPLGLGGNEGRVKARVNATRPAAGAAPPAAAAGGPQAFNAPGGSGFDPRLLTENSKQTGLLASIDRQLRGGGNPGSSPIGGLPADGGDFSPRRA